MQTCSEIEAASETRDESVRCGLSFFFDDWGGLCSSLVFFSNFLYSLRAIFFRFSANAWPTKHKASTCSMYKFDISRRKFAASSALNWMQKLSPLSLFPIFIIFSGFLQRDFIFPLNLAVCFLLSCLISSSAILNFEMPLTWSLVIAGTSLVSSFPV